MCWPVMDWDGVSMAVVLNSVVLSMSQVLRAMVDPMVILKILMVSIVMRVIEMSIMMIIVVVVMVGLMSSLIELSMSDVLEEMWVVVDSLSQVV